MRVVAKVASKNEKLGATRAAIMITKKDWEYYRTLHRSVVFVLLMTLKKLLKILRISVNFLKPQLNAFNFFQVSRNRYNC
jgi:hypothetical protein